MGQLPNKYHITDEGKVFRINDDGSFTKVGNIEDIETKPSDNESEIKTSVGKVQVDPPKVSWWNRNYNWLWAITLFFLLGWFGDCIANHNNISTQEWIDGELVEVGAPGIGFGVFLLPLCFGLSWFLSRKRKSLLQLFQILLIIIGYAIIGGLSRHSGDAVVNSLANVTSILWIVAVCLSIFKPKNISFDNKED